MKKAHIIAENRIKNYDHINHIELRSCIENNDIHDTYLEGKGKICNEPETWGIVCTIKDGTIVDNFLYESNFEYRQDVKILGL